MKSVSFTLISCFAASTVFAHDPLELPETVHAAPLDLTVQDAGRDRALPVRVHPPATTKAAPVVPFSHGLGGSRESNP